MKRAYVVQISTDWEVRSYFERVDEKLRNREAFVFWGAARHLGKGYYAVAIETMTGLLIGPIMLMVTGVIAYLLFGWVGASNWLTAIGGLLWLFATLVVSPEVQQLIMRVRLRKLTGKWMAVRPATKDTIWRLAHGKI